MNRTGIEYLTHSWNPIAMRCSPIAKECQNCWHIAMCKRQAVNPTLPLEVRAAKAGGPPVLLAGELDAPCRLRKPARIGVQFMGDLFHEGVTDEQIQQVWRTMRPLSWHRFLVLTKRPERMAGITDKDPSFIFNDRADHIWLGTTVGHPDSQWRIEELRKCPAAMRFLSVEPLLGELDLGLRIEPPPGSDLPATPWPIVDQIIIGCETGPHRRPCKLEWVKSLIDQADAAGVPVFVKALEICGQVTTNMAAFPVWARRREFPGGT